MKFIFDNYNTNKIDVLTLSQAESMMNDHETNISDIQSKVEYYERAVHEDPEQVKCMKEILDTVDHSKTFVFTITDEGDLYIEL